MHSLIAKLMSATTILCPNLRIMNGSWLILNVERSVKITTRNCRCCPVASLEGRPTLWFFQLPKINIDLVYFLKINFQLTKLIDYFNLIRYQQVSILLNFETLFDCLCVSRSFQSFFSTFIVKYFFFQ